MAMKPQLWTINGLAVELGIDRRTVTQQIKDVPPGGKKGPHDAWWLADVAPLLIVPQKSERSEELATYQAEIAKARAEKLRRENLEAQGDLIPKQDLVNGVVSVFNHVRARLLAIPTKAAPNLVLLETPAAIKEHLTEAIYDALNELAETKVVGVSEDDVESAGHIDLAPLTGSRC